MCPCSALPRTRSDAMVATAAMLAAWTFAAGPATTPAWAAPGAPEPAKLQVLRADASHGHLDVLATITKRANGDRVKVSFIANGTRAGFTERVRDGRIRFKRRLAAAQRRMSTGIMQIRYEGNDLVRPAEVRLRAASKRADLKRELLSLDAGELTARGSLATRARGVVRLILSYVRSDGSVREWQGRAPLRQNGRWSLQDILPPEARAGGHMSIQFTGSYPEVRGEQIAKELLAGQSFSDAASPDPRESPAAKAESKPAPTAAPAPSVQRTPPVTTSSIGAAVLSDAVAAARVTRSSFEPRPNNSLANRRVPTAAELRNFVTYSPYWGPCAERLKPHITGNFTGTTDEIIQWAAHKWGIDENIVRAVAVKESYWNQDARGDWDSNIRDYQSYGLTQVRRNSRGESGPNWDGTFPLSRDSTAFNLDFWGASVRQYYEGCSTWLNDVGGNTYYAGDIWGSVGAWYAGRWWNADAQWYIGEVKTNLENRVWAQPGF